LTVTDFAQTTQLQNLQKQVETLTEELQDSEQKRKDVEKEQEDLLVLLDEVTSKRRRDKARLREAGMEVSEDEADDDGEDDE
jgi:chromosome segregation ATPase